MPFAFCCNCLDRYTRLVSSYSIRSENLCDKVSNLSIPMSLLIINLDQSHGILRVSFQIAYPQANNPYVLEASYDRPLDWSMQPPNIPGLSESSLSCERLKPIDAM